MTNDNGNDKTVLGALCLTLILLTVLVSIAVIFAVGYGFGREWGWLALAAFLVLYCVVIGSTIRKIAKEEREDG